MPPPNLQSAFTKVWRNGGGAGADEQTVAHFAREAEAELAWLHAQRRDGRYRPQPVRRAWIPKPGSKERRPLGMPTGSSYCTGRSRVWGLRWFNAI